MSEGGRIVNHEAHYLPDPKATIILVGYQAVGTLGRMLEDGAKEVEMNGEKIKVRAEIKTIEGYSSHKDSDHLIEFVEKANTPPNPPLVQGREDKKLKKVFVIMGEPKSSLFLCQRLRDYLDVPAIYPEEGKEYIL
jgi:metallo-beta-lactamase family protein